MSSGTTKKDPSAAFPTAQWIAAMRAVDARSTKPKIGSNIGAGPDLAAQIFAGELGFEFMKDYMAAFQMKEEDQAASSFVARTIVFDKGIMDAHESGIRQFVLVAAGLDARPWRIPLDKSSKIFEVDIPESFEYKSKLIPQIQEFYPNGPACQRIEVSADLSKDTWGESLINAGFDVTKPSYFLVEGLTMYLDPGEPEKLYERLSKLMCKGSLVQGDTTISAYTYSDPNFVNLLAKYGTAFTHSFEDVATFSNLLQSLQFGLVEKPRKVIDMVHEVENDKGSAQASDCDEEVAEKAAENISNAYQVCHVWPVIAQHWLVATYVNSTDGGMTIVKTSAEDKFNHHNIRNVTEATRARVIDLLVNKHKLLERLPEIIEKIRENPEIKDIPLDAGYYVYIARKN